MLHLLMMTALLFSCDAASFQASPLTSTVAVPAVENAEAVSMRRFVWPSGTDSDPLQLSDQDLLSLLAWLGGDHSHDPLVEQQLATGTLEYAVIEVTREAISVGGEPVVQLQGDRVSDADKRGYTIMPLYDALVSRVSPARGLYSQVPSKEFPGEVLLIVDSTVSYATLTEVLYTAGQAQLQTFSFAVSDATPDPWKPFTPAADDQRVVVSEQADGLVVQTASGAAPHQGQDLVQLLQQAFPDSSPDCALYAPRATHTWGQVAARADQLRGSGVRQLVFAMDSSPPAEPSTASPPSGTSTPLSL